MRFGNLPIYLPIRDLRVFWVALYIYIYIYIYVLKHTYVYIYICMNRPQSVIKSTRASYEAAETQVASRRAKAGAVRRHARVVHRGKRLGSFWVLGLRV